MLMPSIFGENVFDDFMESFGSRWTNTLMRTDVEEKEDGYEITMDLPGVKKEDIHAELKDGYLTINASSNSSKDEKDEEGNYIRRERYSGSASRRFYVGDAVTQEDIKARFEDGTLKLLVPKKDKNPEVEQRQYISIEG